MDANNNVFNGRLTKLLKDKLEMCEAVHKQVPGQGPNTHIDGSVPIDGIWYTPDLTLERASYLPFDPQLGDHRPVMAEFTQESVLGARLPRVVPHKARRLTSKVKRICQKYVDNLEGMFRKYKIQVKNYNVT